MMMIINYYYCYTDHCVCKGVVEFLPHPSPVWLLEGFRVQGLGFRDLGFREPEPHANPKSLTRVAVSV